MENNIINTIEFFENRMDTIKKEIGVLEKELNEIVPDNNRSYNPTEKLNKETYTSKEVIELLNDFGEHVSEQCIGKRLSMIGEMYKWNMNKH